MSERQRGQRRLTLLFLVGLMSGCIKAPNTLYMVDEKTALEKQATGEFASLETELSGALLKPAVQPYLASELGAGQRSEATELASLSSIYNLELNEQERVNLLLVRRCVGESMDGLLVQTASTCAGATDVTEVVALVQRVNRNRKQLFSWIGKNSPSLDEKTIVERWREAHLKAVICGGQIELKVGVWGVKEC